jgi:hypothetical protein
MRLACTRRCLVHPYCRNIYVGANSRRREVETQSLSLEGNNMNVVNVGGEEPVSVVAKREVQLRSPVVIR